MKLIAVCVIKSHSGEQVLVPWLYRGIDEARSKLPEFVEEWRGTRREIDDMRTYEDGVWYLYTGSPDYYFVAREIPVIE